MEPDQAPAGTLNESGGLQNEYDRREEIGVYELHQ